MKLTFDLSAFPEGTTAHAFRPLTAEEAEFTLDIEPDDADPADSFSEPEDVEFVREGIRRGNPWAWFFATVTATWGDSLGQDSLGGCSYKDEADFKGPGGYFDDMKRGALRQLNEELECEWNATRAEAIRKLMPLVLATVTEWAQGAHEPCLTCARCEAVQDAKTLLSWLRESKQAPHGHRITP